MSDKSQMRGVITIEVEGNTKESKWSRFRNSIFARYIAWPALIFMMMGRNAHAAGDLEDMGGDLGSGLCEFIDGPIPTIIVGVGLLGCVMALATNEDKGLVTTVLKIAVGGICILYLANLLGMVGFNVDALMNCSNS
jgi:hypothetical protein